MTHGQAETDNRDLNGETKHHIDQATAAAVGERTDPSQQTDNHRTQDIDDLKAERTKDKIMETNTIDTGTDNRGAERIRDSNTDKITETCPEAERMRDKGAGTNTDRGTINHDQ